MIRCRSYGNVGRREAALGSARSESEDQLRKIES